MQNEDMAGWIAIDGTTINYPVMQSKNNPNSGGAASCFPVGIGCQDIRRRDHFLRCGRVVESVP